LPFLPFIPPGRRPYGPEAGRGESLPRGMRSIFLWGKRKNPNNPVNPVEKNELSDFELASSKELFHAAA